MCVSTLTGKYYQYRWYEDVTRRQCIRAPSVPACDISYIFIVFVPWCIGYTKHALKFLPCLYTPQNYLRSMIPNDEKCNLEIIYMVALAVTSLNKKKALFTKRLDLNLRKKIINWYIWSIGFYGVEAWTRLKLDQKYLEDLEIWCWRRV